MNLFYQSTAGKFRPSWRGESRKVAGYNIRVKGVEFACWHTFSNLREAVAYRPLFSARSVNIIV